MLSKKKRVTKDLFQAIMKSGKVIQSPFFIFRYIKQNPPNYAFVAPKSIAKTATERNKLRRRGYNSLSLMVKIPLAGIFFYKKEAKNATFKEIKEDIGDLLSKIKA
jgi:ribonuclease P protein component